MTAVDWTLPGRALFAGALTFGLLCNPWTAPLVWMAVLNGAAPRYRSMT